MRRGGLPSRLALCALLAAPAALPSASAQERRSLSDILDEVARGGRQPEPAKPAPSAGSPAPVPERAGDPEGVGPEAGPATPAQVDDAIRAALGRREAGALAEGTSLLGEWVAERAARSAKAHYFLARLLAASAALATGTPRGAELAEDSRRHLERARDLAAAGDYPDNALWARHALDRLAESSGRGRVDYGGCRVSSPVVRAVLQRLAHLTGRTVRVTSGDRGFVPAGGSARSLHLAHRAADFAVDGQSLGQTFELLRAHRDVLFAGGSFEVIWHGDATNTTGPHLHVGDFGDGQGTTFRIENRGEYRYVP